MANEILRQPIYDTQSISAGSVSAGTTYKFFAVPLGQSSKTLLDTNLTTAGQLPYANATVVGLRVHAYTRGTSAITVGDYNQLLNNCTLTFKKEDRVILECPLYMIPSGIGLTGAVSTNDSTTTILSAISNGMAVKTNYFDLLQPEPFESRDRLQFDVDVKATWTASANIYVVVILEAQIGKIYR